MRSPLFSSGLTLAYFLMVEMASTVKGESKRKIVQIPGDLVLGGLFPMHEQVLIEIKYLVAKYYTY